MGSQQDALLWAPASPCRLTMGFPGQDIQDQVQAWSPVKHFRQTILARQIYARRTDTFLRAPAPPTFVTATMELVSGSPAWTAFSSTQRSSSAIGWPTTLAAWTGNSLPPVTTR